MAGTPQSYLVDTPTGTLRRNHGDLNVMPHGHNTDKHPKLLEALS